MQIRQIPVNQLTYFQQVGKHSHSNAYVDQLAQDIAKNGIRRPLIVRPVGDMFQVVAGLARWKGAIISGLETVTSEVRQLTDSEAMMVAMMDNMSPMEIDTPAMDGEMPAGEMSDDEMTAMIAESSSAIAAVSIEQTPTFVLDEPLPQEFCVLFREDFDKAEMIEGALKLNPKADPATCEEDFNRFTTGLDNGRLHLEGHRYAVNESLLAYIESYLTPDSLKTVFGPIRWNSMTQERRDAIMAYVETAHPMIQKL